MKITKVKIKPNDTEIAYLESGAVESKEVVFRSWDTQSKEFLELLQVLKPYVIYILELPDGYEQTMEIRGITIKYEEAGIGVVISAVKNLESLSAPLCLNTPYIPPKRDEHVNTPMCGGLEMSIEKITVMAQQFMEGQHRAQGQLFEKEAQNA